MPKRQDPDGHLIEVGQTKALTAGWWPEAAR
jgi:hypothetical protein